MQSYTQTLELHDFAANEGRKLIQHDGKDIALEIGGKGKGRSQFKGIATDRKLVLAPDIAPQPDRLPLHLVGYLAIERIACVNIRLTFRGGGGFDPPPRLPLPKLPAPSHHSLA